MLVSGSLHPWIKEGPKSTALFSNELRYFNSVLIGSMLHCTFITPTGTSRYRLWSTKYESLPKQQYTIDK